MIVSTDKVIVVVIKDTSMGSEGVKIEKVYRPIIVKIIQVV